MEMALTFNEVTLTPVSHQNSLWIRAVELARALGFKRDDQVAKIYRVHADEFTSDMAQVIEISDNAESAFPVKSLLFSLRGCHLLAMFARTPVAKAFRRWVLDVLDKLAEEERAKAELTRNASRLADAPLTPDQQCTLRAIVKARIEDETQNKGKRMAAYAQVWSRFANHFRLAKYSQLPQRRMSEAIAYLVNMEIKPALKAEKSEKQALDLSLDAKTYKHGKRFFDEMSEALKNLERMREIMHLVARPGPRDAVLPTEKQVLYDNMNDSVNTAVTGLNIAIYGLRSACRIGSRTTFCKW